MLSFSQCLHGSPWITGSQEASHLTNFNTLGGTKQMIQHPFRPQMTSDMSLHPLSLRDGKTQITEGKEMSPSRGITSSSLVGTQVLFLSTKACDLGTVMGTPQKEHPATPLDISEQFSVHYMKDQNPGLQDVTQFTCHGTLQSLTYVWCRRIFCLCFTFID